MNDSKLRAERFETPIMPMICGTTNNHLALHVMDQDDQRG